MLLNLLKSQYPRAMHAKESYARGYDWAAGGVLRGEHTPGEVTAFVEAAAGVPTPFDQGALDAVRRLKALDALINPKGSTT